MVKKEKEYFLWFLPNMLKDLKFLVKERSVSVQAIVESLVPAYIK